MDSIRTSVVALLVCGGLAASAARGADAEQALRAWFDEYRDQHPDHRLIQDQNLLQLELVAGADLESLADLERFRAAFAAYHAHTSATVHDSSPADLIATIRHSEVIGASSEAARFRAYAELLERFELAAQDGSEAAVLLLLEIAAHDLDRESSEASLRKQVPFRPHLVRREARSAILRVAHDRALLPLLATLSTIVGGPSARVTAAGQEIAASLIAVIAAREPLGGFRRHQTFQIAFVQLEHGKHEGTRLGAAAILRSLLQRNPEHGMDEGRQGRLLSLALKGRSEPVRVAALRLLQLVPSERVIERLAETLAERSVRSDRILDEMLDTLDAITPVSLDGRADPDAWLAWFREEKGTPRLAEWLDRQRRPFLLDEKLKKRYAASPRFYGVPVLGQRVVFVIDVSGSMQEPATENGRVAKIAMARSELLATIRALPESTLVNVVKFNTGVRIWAPKLVRATGANKEKAGKFVRGNEASGWTNLFAALTRAFAVEGIGEPVPQGRSLPNQIILLSDGRPTVGLLTNAVDIVEEIGQLNRHQAIRIDTIAFGGDADQEFLKSLAERNGGNMIVFEAEDQDEGGGVDNQGGAVGRVH